MVSIRALWAWSTSSWSNGATWELMSAERDRSNGSWSALTSVIRPPVRTTATCTLPYRVDTTLPSTVRTPDPAVVPGPEPGGGGPAGAWPPVSADEAGTVAPGGVGPTVATCGTGDDLKD